MRQFIRSTPFQSVSTLFTNNSASAFCFLVDFSWISRLYSLLRACDGLSRYALPGWQYNMLVSKLDKGTVAVFSHFPVYHLRSLVAAVLPPHSRTFRARWEAFSPQCGAHPRRGRLVASFGSLKKGHSVKHSASNLKGKCIVIKKKTKKTQRTWLY